MNQQQQKFNNLGNINNLSNMFKLNMIPKILLYCVTFVSVMSFLIPLLAHRHDKRNIQETGDINTAFLVLSIAFPFIYFTLTIMIITSSTLRMMMFILTIGLSVVNLYVLNHNTQISNTKIQHELIINFGVGLLLFSLILWKASSDFSRKTNIN